MIKTLILALIFIVPLSSHAESTCRVWKYQYSGFHQKLLDVFEVPINYVGQKEKIFIDDRIEFVASFLDQAVTVQLYSHRGGNGHIIGEKSIAYTDHLSLPLAFHPIAGSQSIKSFGNLSESFRYQNSEGKTIFVNVECSLP